ncbi:AMP-binding protein [Coxiella burnetii]|uniref:AMP-binding protein n=1 Tax=Coxiella burnetii TaxID=777 RepID=UPI002230C255|nr:class I adenylate-forming enzyme family protein [Coxiella burnetii]
MMNNITDSANLLEALEKTGKKYPQQIALTIQGDDQQVNYGYQRLLEKVDEFAARFKSANIQSGQRVVIISQNHPEAIVAYFAILKCQATAALIDINLPKKDIVQLIQAAKPSALVFSEELANLLSDTAATGYPAFDHYNNAALHVNFAKEAPLSEDETSDVATLLFTSGTTGNYKGVMLTHQNLLSQIESCRQALKITCNDRFLSVLPLHHVFPFVSSLLTPLIIGCSTMQISKIEGSFLLTAIQVHKPTILVVVPSILELFYQRIRGKINQLDSKQQKFISWLEKINQTSLNLLKLNLGKIFFRKIQNNFGGKLRYIVSGGATLDGQLHLALARLGFLILEGYGLTEVSGPCTVNRIDNHRLGTVGLPIPGTKIKIEKSTREGIGEIVIQGPGVMRGYFEDEKSTRAAIKQNWFYSGDLGKFDEKGFLVITGRAKELIITADGKNIMPAYLEQHYSDIEGIEECAAVGIKNKGGSEEVYLAVIKNKHQEKDKVRQRLFACASKLPPYLRFQHVFFVDEIPKTSLLKIRRQKLAKQLTKKKTVKPKVSQNSGDGDGGEIIKK